MINPSEVFFVNSITKELRNNIELYFSIRGRERSEVNSLANILNIEYKIIGKDYPNAVQKKIGLILRLFELTYKIPKFDVSLSFGNFMSILLSKLRFVPSISFLDNDLALIEKGLVYENFYKRIEAHSDYIVCPSAFYTKGLIDKGAEKENIFNFNGFKENIYIADFIPDPNFLTNLPFEEFVTVRPEALFAAYVQEGSSIVPLLLKYLIKEKYNIVYLPRVESDIKYAKGLDVFIPKKALNGVNLCYYSTAILPGSGTLAREAACMGTPSISFFQTNCYLSTKGLVNQGKIFHSRDPLEIV